MAAVRRSSSTPRIGLDLVYLAPGRTGGMEVHARELVPRLVRGWPEARFTAFVGQELAAEMATTPWVDGLDVVALPVRSDTRFSRVAVEQVVLPLHVLRRRLDLLHSMASTTALLAPTKVVVTIHDLIYQRHPDAHPGILTRGVALLVPAAARRAKRVLTPSAAAKADVVDFLKLPPEHVDVISSGPGQETTATPTPAAELRERLHVPDGPIVLSVSARRPHKNLPRLIDALRDVDATLVVPGYETAFEDDLRAHADDGGRVVFTGWLDDADIEGLYRAATVMAFPSLAEGFGLPVLEAMRRGLPVTCSNQTSLPELVGDAALLFDPTSTEQIEASVRRLLEDGALRDELAARGRVQAAKFSWDRTAEAVIASYRRVLDGTSAAAERSRRNGLDRSASRSAVASTDPDAANRPAT